MALSNIVIEHETRPCYYEGKRAMFHSWSEHREAISESPMVGGHPAGIIAATLAIIELEDGTVKEVYPEKIKFADGGKFNSIAWTQEVKQ